MKNIPAFYKALSAFYTTWSLPHAVEMLSSGIKAAQDKEVWKEGSPSALLYFFERLQELVEAVYALPDAKAKKIAAKLDSDKQHWWLTEYSQYCGWPKGHSPWDFLPRYLTQKEYLDPWKALQKVKRWQSLKEWKELLKELLNDALSHTSIHDLMNGERALNAWILLHKLLEATHLIEVRAIEKDEDGPRPKWVRRELNEC